MMRWSTRWVEGLRFAGIATFLLPGAAPAQAASITGVCPDGSIYIVQRREAIPCRDSKQVEPHDIPPFKAEYLPRPYGWQQHQLRQDRNNPYNLVDLAPSLERPGRRPPTSARRGAEAPAPRLEPPTAADPGGRPEAPASRPTSPPDAPFSEGELRDLALLVGAAQRGVPATFPPDGQGRPTLRIARSEAFEPRLREIWRAYGGLGEGRVLLFHASNESGPAVGEFHARLAFVQERAFHPDPRNPREIGLLSGALGPLQRDQAVLGYVVLPPDFDLARPLDIYWNDRLLTVNLVESR